MRIISKVIEFVIDGSKNELEKKLKSLKEKYYIVFEDIFENEELNCYTLQVKYVERGIY